MQVDRHQARRLQDFSRKNAAVGDDDEQIGGKCPELGRELGCADPGRLQERELEMVGDRRHFGRFVLESAAARLVGTSDDSDYPDETGAVADQPLEHMSRQRGRAQENRPEWSLRVR